MAHVVDIGGLGQHLNKLTPEEKAIRIGAFYTILEGKPASIDTLALKSGIAVDQTRQYIMGMADRGILVMDKDENVVGSHGLSVIPTKHHLNINGQNLFTWCAIDAVGIAAALELEAKIVSKCFQCNETIEIDMANGKIINCNQKDTRIWVVEADLNQPIVCCTCPQINFFCSKEHFNEWYKNQNKGKLLSLTEAVKLGNCWWSDIKVESSIFLMRR